MASIKIKDILVMIMSLFVISIIFGFFSVAVNTTTHALQNATQTVAPYGNHNLTNSTTVWLQIMNNTTEPINVMNGLINTLLGFIPLLFAITVFLLILSTIVKALVTSSDDISLMEDILSGKASTKMKKGEYEEEVESPFFFLFKLWDVAIVAIYDFKKNHKAAFWLLFIVIILFASLLIYLLGHDITACASVGSQFC